MDKKQPVMRFRAGRNRVAVWENKGANGTWYSVTPSRSYRDERGNWQDTSSFGLQDIPVLCRLLDQAYDYLYSLQGLSGTGSEGDEVMAGGNVPESGNDVPAEPA